MSDLPRAQDRARTEETNAGDNGRRDAHRITLHVQAHGFTEDQKRRCHEQRSTRPNQHVGPDAGLCVRNLTLETDRPSENGGNGGSEDQLECARHDRQDAILLDPRTPRESTPGETEHLTLTPTTFAVPP